MTLCFADCESLVDMDFFAWSNKCAIARRLCSMTFSNERSNSLLRIGDSGLYRTRRDSAVFLRTQLPLVLRAQRGFILPDILRLQWRRAVAKNRLYGL